MKPETKAKIRSILKHRAARKNRILFAKRRKKKILSLSMSGWPHMTLNKDYEKWLDLVYSAKERGLYSMNTANCDVISNLRNNALKQF